MEKLLERSKQNFSNLKIIKHPLPLSTYSLQIPETSKDIFQWKTLKGSACRKATGPEILSRFISRCFRIPFAQELTKTLVEPWIWNGKPVQCQEWWLTQTFRLKVASGHLKHQACAECIVWSEGESQGKQSGRPYSFILCISVKSVASFEVRGRLIRHRQSSNIKNLCKDRGRQPLCWLSQGEDFEKTIKDKAI